MTELRGAGYLLAVTAVAGGVTLLLRAMPFLFFANRKPSPWVLYLGRKLSPAAIAMLVVYCLVGYARERIPAEHAWGAAEILASLTVVGMQLWKRNPLLSILAGTALYMVLVQTVLR